MASFPRKISPKPIFSLALIGAFGLLAVLSMPSKPAAASPAVSSIHSQAGNDRACFSRLILSSGGRCCHKTSSVAQMCMNTKPGPYSAAVKKLPPLYVDGFEVPLPVVLQMVKKAFSQSQTATSAQAQLVCRKHHQVGSHLLTMSCQVVGTTNPKAGERKPHCYEGCMATRQNLIVALSRYVNHDARRASTLFNLLGKAPADDATYTLRMKDQMLLEKKQATDQEAWFFPVYATFVVENGALANVKFTKRAGKPTKVRNPREVVAKRAAPPQAPSAKAATTTARNTGELCKSPSMSC